MIWKILSGQNKYTMVVFPTKCSGLSIWVYASRAPSDLIFIQEIHNKLNFDL